MAIKTKEREVPRKFPPARIYLDDLQEIVEILSEARQYSQIGPASVDGERISFECGNKTCDTFQELKSIGGTHLNFKIQIVTYPGCHRSLDVYRSGPQRQKSVGLL